MKRRLTPEEARLWRIATANVRPLDAHRPRHSRRDSLCKGADDRAIDRLTRVAAPPKEKPQLFESCAVKSPPRAQAPAAPRFLIDAREKKELRKGKLPIQARIDLHGLRAHEAHDRLVEFLIHSHDSGLRFVLVITGKGGAHVKEDWLFEKSGVIRRQTPYWLMSPKLQHVVSGFDEAAAPHGGGGALYVRLRRRKI